MKYVRVIVYKATKNGQTDLTFPFYDSGVQLVSDDFVPRLTTLVDETMQAAQAEQPPQAQP